ncbi:MAG: hypothetical protein KA807_12830 [Prolixibacteraceae bacterium]|nr:hypothetical protein [Prolixibacteraceae bacterium]
MRSHTLKGILILLFLNQSTIYSQSLNSLKAVGKPDIFYIPVYNADINSPYTIMNRYWIVYSDRDNNHTFTSSGGNVIKNTLYFMEKFRVAEISDSYVHIYKENMPTIWPQISSEAVDYGWIRKENLLLWEHCLRNSSSLIDKKAMILSTFEGTTNQQTNDEAITYKLDPDLTLDSERKSRLFEILFVYKTTQDAVLLGENMELQGNEVDIVSNMRGWVPLESVTFWDHRITLEPNWEQAAAKERTEKGVLPAIFIDEKAAMDYQRGIKVDPKYIVWENEPGPKRNIGQWRRFPILETRNSGIHHTGVMGKIRSESTIMDTERMAEIRKAIETLEMKTRKINVVFVVDGTESMGKFYESIASGIRTSVNNLQLEDTQNRFSFGAVIYRDFAEGENKVELRQLTENYKEIIEFFNIARTDYSRDKDLPEAVFFGLKTALTQLGIKKGESNFIVLIGDCGNHYREDDTQVPIETVIDLLAQTESSLISYQVNNGFYPTYQEFIDQSRRMIIGSALSIRKIREENKIRWINENSNLEDPQFLSPAPNKFTLNPQEIVGSYLFPGIGQSLSFEILEEEIISKIEEFDTRISQMLAKSYEVIRGAGTPDSESEEVDEYHPAVINFLSKIQGLSSEEIEIMKNRNYQFSMKGYTAKSVNNMYHPIFKESLFLSREDLLETIMRLNSLCGISGSSMSDRRIKMQNIWIDILESIIGSEKREEIMNMPVDDLHNIVFGLPSQSQFTAKVRLRDIIEVTVIDDTKFELYADYLCNKLSSLRSIINDQNYNESFVSNNITYYWIPMELFP